MTSNFADGERFIITAGDFREAMTGLAEGLAIRTTQASPGDGGRGGGALFWFLNRTRTGKSMRAFSDNEDLALLSGINPERVVQVTWIIVAALATIAGVLYGLDKSFKPFTYFQLCCRSLPPPSWAAWAARWAPSRAASSSPFPR
jgi:branched-chain amino acid transport system permease protein